MAYTWHHVIKKIKKNEKTSQPEIKLHPTIMNNSIRQKIKEKFCKKSGYKGKNAEHSKGQQFLTLKNPNFYTPIFPDIFRKK